MYPEELLLYRHIRATVGNPTVNVLHFSIRKHCAVGEPLGDYAWTAKR